MQNAWEVYVGNQLPYEFMKEISEYGYTDMESAISNYLYDFDISDDDRNTAQKGLMKKAEKSARDIGLETSIDAFSTVDMEDMLTDFYFKYGPFKKLMGESETLFPTGIEDFDEIMFKTSYLQLRKYYKEARDEFLDCMVGMNENITNKDRIQLVKDYDTNDVYFLIDGDYYITFTITLEGLFICNLDSIRQHNTPFIFKHIIELSEYLSYLIGFWDAKISKEKNLK